MNYLNFGEFYRNEAMRASEPEIHRVQQENAAQYPFITACLAAADCILQPVRAATEPYREEMEAIAECLALSALTPVGNKPQVTHRFLSAVTPKGLHSCWETARTLCDRIYVLHDHYGFASAVLQQLLIRAKEKGHTCVVCHSPLLPDAAPAHLLIPTAGAAFISDTLDFPYEGESFCSIDLNSSLHPQKRSALEFSLRTVSSLVQEASVHMKEAKRLHDRIEQLCHPFVDFDAVDALTDETIMHLFDEK